MTSQAKTTMYNQKVLSRHSISGKPGSKLPTPGRNEGEFRDGSSNRETKKLKENLHKQGAEKQPNSQELTKASKDSTMKTQTTTPLKD